MSITIAVETDPTDVTHYAISCYEHGRRELSPLEAARHAYWEARDAAQPLPAPVKLSSTYAAYWAARDKETTR